MEVESIRQKLFMYSRNKAVIAGSAPTRCTKEMKSKKVLRLTGVEWVIRFNTVSQSKCQCAFTTFLLELKLYRNYVNYPAEHQM